MGAKQSSDERAVRDLDKFANKKFVVADHCPRHQPIVDLGDTAVYYTNDSKLKHRTQYKHYYFRPQMQHLIETTDPTKSKALLYVKPGPAVRRRLEGQRLYFVSKPKEGSKGDTKEPIVRPEEEAELDLAFFADDRLEGLAGAAALEALAQPSARGEDLNSVSECALCATTAMIDPLMSECKHVCCNDCWLTWLDETGDAGGSCPVCDLPVDLEHLYPVEQCIMCMLNPTVPWKAPCGHVGCTACWSSWLDNGNDSCPTCSEPFDRSLFDADLEPPAELEVIREVAHEVEDVEVVHESSDSEQESKGL